MAAVQVGHRRDARRRSGHVQRRIDRQHVLHGQFVIPLNLDPFVSICNDGGTGISRHPDLGEVISPDLGQHAHPEQILFGFLHAHVDIGACSQFNPQSQIADHREVIGEFRHQSRIQGLGKCNLPGDHEPHQQGLREIQ